MYAPIIVSAFNRVDTLKETVSSLLKNKECSESDFFLFVDGPRKEKMDETIKVIEVQEYGKSISGFKSISLLFSENNKGLGPSIISGVSQVINKYGRAIIVEDDLYLGKNFLSYVNQGLDRYIDNQHVFSICGYSNRVKPPKGYEYDSYFCPRSSSWGWATWVDRWNSVDWKLENFESYRAEASAFNRWGGSDCWHMLNEWHSGGNKSWAIRFCFSQFLQDKVSLFPTVSKVDNNRGFDGGGTNCKRYSRFKFDFDSSENKKFCWPTNSSVNKSLRKQCLRYHSIPLRIFSRLMYLIYR